MSQFSPRLALPYLQSAQAQKHVTHNEALKVLDAATQLSVLASDLIDPPSSPAEGDCYIPAPGPTGDWAGHGGDVAIYSSGAWQFFEARQGWRADVTPTGASLRFDGNTWQAVTPDLQNLPEVGVNTTADATNRLAVASDATLLTHDGDNHQLKINKAGAPDTASLLFQTGFSGRAEMGITGSDDFAIKVSPDGTTFHTAAVMDKDNGTMAVQSLASLKANAAPVSSMLFTPGGDGVVSIYRTNGVSGAPARIAAISGLSGDTLTLSSPDAALFIEDNMEGVSYVRIWNTSKATPQSAWLIAKLSADQLQVTDPADISGWSATETIQVGDPAGYGFGGNIVTLDISPMQINLFGQAFRQTGVMCKAALLSGTVGDKIAVTPNGGPGTLYFCAQEGVRVGTTISPTTELSPISNSNLIGIDESIASTAGVRFVSIVALMV